MLNTIILEILYNFKPEDVKIVLIDTRIINFKRLFSMEKTVFFAYFIYRLREVISHTSLIYNDTNTRGHYE